MQINTLDDTGAARRERWGQARRLHFIDTRLCWEGRLNRSDLTDFFRISVPQASLDLAEYQRRAPANAVYDPSQRTYVATRSFQPLFSDCDSARYLAELYGLVAQMIPRELSFLGAIPDADVVRSPMRVVPPDVLKHTVFAIRDRAMLRIAYQSMRAPDPEVRSISPHALGYDGHRWHIRAYCHARQEFRDFLFARILELTAEGPSDISGAQDTEWHDVIDVVIGPNPELDAQRRRIIELDYGMTDGRAVIRARAALGFYLMRRLGLIAAPLHGHAHQQQIVLLNQGDLASYLPRWTQG